MAQAIYPKYKEAVLTGSSNSSLTSGAVKVVAVTSAYTYSASHQFLSDVGGGTRVATSGNLANKSVALGVFNADPWTYATLTGSAIAAFVFFIDTGVEATSRLVFFDDVGTGLPFTPSGTDLTITPDVGSNKIFAL